MLQEDAGARALAVRRMREAGAAVVRIPVDWRDTVLPVPAPGFQPENPGDPSYLFSRVDAAVRSAAAAGLEPLLVVSHAPAFAEAPDRWPYAFLGSWAPSPEALRAFAAALARRYDGSFPDPLQPGRTLPRVRLLQAWNEPNLARYLEPQWVARDGRWSAFSPLLYRQMLNAFYAGVKAAVPSDVVVAAGVAPNGERAGVGRMAPVTFLRSLLCVDAAGQRTGCADRAHLDVLDFHPLSVDSPDRAARSALDVSISDAAKITGLLARAERLGTVLPAGRRPVWVTELNWESAPQARGGVPPSLQAAWISRALHRLWVAGVSLVAWQFLLDPFPNLTSATATGGIFEYQRPAGLYAPGPTGGLQGARPKAFLTGFALPFDPLRVNRRQIRVWALLGGPGARALLVRRLRSGAWSPLAVLRAGGNGVLNVLLTVRGSQQLRLRSAGLTSATAALSAARSRL